jgi:hypothetical protein
MKVLLLLALFSFACNNTGDPGDEEDSTSNSGKTKVEKVDTLKVDTVLYR